MENKKLLKYILRDLRELEELIVEKENNCFNELEMEFLQTRVSGAKRMIQILFDEEKRVIRISWVMVLMAAGIALFLRIVLNRLYLIVW